MTILLVVLTVGYFNYKKNKICKFKPLSTKCLFCNCDSRNYVFKIYRIFRQIIYKKNVKKINYAISISDFSEKILRNCLKNSCKITRIYNPIDFEVNAKKEKPENSDYFLYVGRISKEKGVDVFCEAIKKTCSKGIVVGDGDIKEKLEKEYPSIEFLGWKNPLEVKKIMKKARCLIIPSKWYECAPLTPLEAMQFGIPCISSSNNATVDYLKNDIGMVYNNLEELIKYIEKCKDNKLISDYSRKSFEYIEEWKKMNYPQSLMKLYNNILQD